MQTQAQTGHGARLLAASIQAQERFLLHNRAFGSQVQRLPTSIYATDELKKGHVLERCCGDIDLRLHVESIQVDSHLALLHHVLFRSC